MFKKIGVFLAVSLMMGTMINYCEARSNVWGDVAKIIVKENNNSKYGSRKQTNPPPKQIEFNLDGSYSRIQLASSMYPKSSIVSEHYFTLNQPSEINLHFIGHTRRYFSFKVFDSDENKLGNQVSVLENATDKTLILKPGRYVIKSSVDHNNGQNKKNIDFEIKGTVRSIPVTVNEANYSRHNAISLLFDKETVDYIPIYTDNEQEFRYYKIMLQTPTTISVLIDQLSKKCNVYFTLLDEDERVIDYVSGFSDNHIVYTKALDAGIYYLRAKRSGDLSESNGAYSIRIK